MGFQFLLGFGLALVLNARFRFRGIVRAAAMVPWVTPGVLIGLIWRWLYDGDYGVINDLLKRMGFLARGIAYLSRVDTALPAAIFSVVWQGVPFFALMLLAALQGVSTEMYEAGQFFPEAVLHHHPVHPEYHICNAAAAGHLGCQFH